MKEKLSIILAVGIGAAIIVTLLFYLQNAGTIELGESIQMIIVLILVGSSTYILWDRIKNLKRGLPVQDERLKVTSYKAGYYGFIISIWSAVLSTLLSGILFDYEIPGRYVTAIVVLAGGLGFMISYFYLFWKGN